MPELPEVETIRLGLQKYLVGHKIFDLEILEKKIFYGDKKNIIGAKVSDVKRIGKGLIIVLNNGYALALHLKLTGQLIYQKKKDKNIILSPKTGGNLPSKITRAIFRLDQEACLYFNDLRKFGWIKVIKKNELMDLPIFSEMGPEPFKDLTKEKFFNIVKPSNLPIKILLMDQKKIAGIGNIYANESLYEAGIKPGKKAKTLSIKEINYLYQATLSVLKKALRYGGSSDANFVNLLGQDGHYQDHFLVYNRAGKPCKNCKGSIKKIKLGGRGTYFCPVCQR